MTKHSKTRPRLKKITIIVNFSRISSTNYKQARVRAATAQELCFLTRGNGPPLRNRGFPRAGTIHRPGIAYSHARERSIAQELRIPTRGKDRKSTRLNSSHVAISYAVFCLKKKKKTSMSTVH